MSFTYTTLKAALFAWTTEADDGGVGDGSSLSENIDTVIALGHRRCQRDLDLDIFVGTSTSTLGAGSYAINRPTDAIEIQEMYYLSGQIRMPLFRRSYAWVRDYWPNPTSTDTAKYFAENGMTDIVVAPTPSAQITWEMRYLARISPLSASVASNWISLNQGDLLLFACLEESEAFLQEESRGRVGLWRGKYDAMLPQAKDETASITRVSGQRAKLAGVVSPPGEALDGD